MKLQGAHVVVMGGSTGIGLAAEEVAQAILMLMTNEHITGEVLHIDGGSRFL